MDLLAAIEERLRVLIREELRALASHNGKPAALMIDGKEAARLLGVPVSWVMSAARRGELKSMHCGHHVRFRISDLKDFVEKQG